MDLQRLRVLHELQKHGSLAAVAEALSFTPSAISQQLSKLEEEVGVALVERVGRGVVLTDAGRVLARHAGSILRAVDAAATEVALVRQEVRGVVRVASFQSAALALLVPAIALLQEREPRLQVELILDEPEAAMPSLLSGELDLVLSDEYRTPALECDGLDRQVLLDDPLKVVLAVDDALAGQPSVRISDLASRSWASGREGSAYSLAVEETCREAGGFQPNVVHRSSDLLLIARLVAATGAVALLPDLVAAENVAPVAVRPTSETAVVRTIATLARSGTAERPTITAVRRALQDVSGNPISPLASPAAVQSRSSELRT